MNTNGLKKFAQNARTKLMGQVESRLDYVLETDSAELREKKKQIDALKKEFKRTSSEAVVEKVAYTWFNRLVALRFMDINDYQPFRIRVISPHEGYTQPELLTEAKQGHIPDELKVDRQRVNDLLNGTLSSQNPQNEVFRLLLVAACNHLNSIFPFLFEPIQDYTELLLPEDLTSEFSIAQDVRDGMPAESCEEVEVIGWLYQFYISEKKDEVFASKGKVKKEEIPAATQLFTPRWIVEYMVQNTIGKLWLQNNPDSSLKEHMDYYIESPSAEADDYLEIDSPEEITFLDPASGSGHILVYAFELLTKIYEEAGYPPSDIPELIITKNLHGIEIDERAAQLSGLSLMMKARNYYRRIFRKDLTPNITCLKDLPLSKKEIKEVFDKEGIELTDELLHDLTNMQQATNYGSLIIPHTDQSTLKNVHQKLSESSNGDDLFEADKKEALNEAITQLLTLGKKYHCVAANPPYMGNRSYNNELKDFVYANYPDSKSDLMASFMEGGLAMLQEKGSMGMINQHSWMFLSSYEELRKKLIKESFIDTLLHLGPRTFPEIGGEVVQNASFIIVKDTLKEDGHYIRLVDFKNSDLKRQKTLEALKRKDCNWYYSAWQHDFNEVPGSPIGYWLGEKWISVFSENDKTIKDYSISDGQNKTGKNARFLRNTWEVDTNSIGKGNKWLLYAKGGSYRKWVGNLNNIINWSKKARKHYRKDRVSRIIPDYLWYSEGITWTFISSSIPSFRYLPKESTFDVGGTSIFIEDKENLYVILGLLNTPITKNIFQLLNPTLNLQLKDVQAIPIDDKILSNKALIQKIESTLELSQLDWNSKETSSNYKKNEFLRIKEEQSVTVNLEEIYDLYKQYWKVKILELQRYEEELNKGYIEIYGLEEELEYEVTLGDITIQQEETEIKNGEIEFKEKEVLAQFISYAVGCMFGRYSLDKEGLILANQGETLEDYLKKVARNENEVSFLPNEDNIIPVLDEDWFEDDIVGRFYAFLKASFGEENFEKNLAFVEDNITHGDIRKYFNKTFYRDHYKRYNKRPIYWMFSSPKGVFKALIYMLRYTPDTLNRMLNDYLREYKSKLTYRKDHLQEIINSSSDATEVNKAEKEQRKLEDMLRELEDYERNVLMPLATDRIEIDLDDGVLVNYNKFGQAVEEIKSVNTPKKKKKVKEFDWVDGGEIR